jgi:hypothetical protein
VRAAFVVLALLTGGAIFLVYVAMWLLIPTAGSTASQPGEIVQENLNDLGARVRSFTGSNVGNGGNGGNGAPAGGNGGNGGNGAPNGTNIVPSQANSMHHMGIGPIILIGLGLFFLFGNLGIFHLILWHAFWPLILIGVGVLLLSKRNR